MKNLISTVLILSAIGFSSISYAEWTYSYNKFKNSYYVSDGTSSIELKTEKAAKKTAKALNKNDKKLEKKADGFWNPREEFCSDPLNDC